MTVHVNTDVFSNDQGYDALGVVARINKIGEYADGPLMRKPIYQFLTFHAGGGKPSFVAKYQRQAAIAIKDGQSFLDASELKVGEIVVSPGFIYKKIPWSSKLMNCHLDAMKTYKPKEIIIASAPTEPAIDLGTVLDLTENKESKNDKRPSINGAGSKKLN